jgi:hypothetical protein
LLSSKQSLRIRSGSRIGESIPSLQGAAAENYFNVEAPAAANSSADARRATQQLAVREPKSY